MWIDLDARERLWLEPVRLWLAGEGEWAVCYDEQNQKVPGIRELRQTVRETEARNEELQTLTEVAITARRDAEAKAAQEARERQQSEQRADDLALKLAALEAELKRLRETPDLTPKEGDRA